MPEKTRNIIQFFRERPILADLSSLAGILIFGILTWAYANSQYSVLDEGNYLYKGWLFAIGRYSPFQDYGPWTNQMPLAFLIPGWVQVLFGAGLRTGRIFTVLIDILMLVGLWLTTRRITGVWIALVVVVAVVLDPAAERMYSEAASQGLAAFLVAWTMYFALGDDRPIWQLFLGGMLAGAVVMVRVNLLPLLPLIVLYVLWEKSWRYAVWMAAGIMVTFGGVQAYFWPNILRLWAKWLPFPFLKPWFSPDSIPTWNPDIPLGYRIASFFLAFRFHFAAMVGAVVVWTLWPREWLNKSRYRIAVFLSILFFCFILLHGWASLGNEYCVFCFPTYTSFYSGLGLLLVAVTLPSLRWDAPAWRVWFGGLFLLLLLGGMAYSAEGTVANILGELFYKRLLSITIPGYGGAQLWQLFANKFQLEYKVIYDTVHAFFPVLLALLSGLVLFFIVGLFLKKFVSKPEGKLVYGSITFGVLLGVGTFFSPSPLFAGDYNTYDCSTSVIPRYEQVGIQLQQSIPPGSTVYWAGYSPTTLLYLPKVKIYPAQLNLVYSFRISANDDALAKYGWWDQALADRWLQQADFVLVDQRTLNGNAWLAQMLNSGYDKLVTTLPQAICQSDSAMLLFRRK